MVQDDTLQASESPALDNVRELLSPTTHEQDVLESRSPRAPYDNADNVGRSPSPKAEDDNTHETSAIAAEGAAPNSRDVTALPQLSHCGLRLNSTNGVTADAGDSSVPRNDGEMSNWPNAVQPTATDEYVLSPASGASPKASGNATSEIADAVFTPNEDGLESRGSELVASSHRSIANTSQKRGAETRSLLSQKAPRSSPRKAKTPGSSQTPKQVRSSEYLRADTPGGSPQIGTSLLRRESLRRRENPSKRTHLRKSRSPKKRDTLQRRDTLQEREILQKVIAEADPDQNMEYLNHGVVETTLATSSESAPNAEALKEETQLALGPTTDDKQRNEIIVDGMEAALPPLHNDEDKDLRRALEAIEVYESTSKSETGDDPLAVPSDNVDMREAIDGANETIAKTELHQTTLAEAAEEQTELPKRKTRSGARFSDDTSMLKEFLNRAQAKKAARIPTLSAPGLPKPQTSPRRSPRKALGFHDDNALSPQKLRNVATRPGTPPGKPKLDSPDSDDADEFNAEPTSCRRSTRTRLPAPSKAPPGAPSFIPVRRADGTDPVVLQKSQAQELAMVTRANTRRNKGQSKPPLLALQDIPVETTETATIAKRRREQTKTVGWAERLASYQDAKETEQAEEVKSKVRRMRGLGSANGIPAPKRATAVVGTSNGTPAPKRRGKVV